MQNFARAVRRHSHQGLRAFCLVLFCFINIAVPQIKVRAAESATIEILPGDSSGGSEQEETTATHALLERSANSRWRSFIRIRPISLPSSQARPVRFAHDAILAKSSSLSERVLPLRC